MPKRSRGISDYINGWTIGAILTLFVTGSVICIGAFVKYASMRADGKSLSESINGPSIPHSLGGTPSAEREGMEWSCDDLGKWFVKKGFAKDYQVNWNTLRLRLNDGMETIIKITQYQTVFDAEEETKTKMDNDPHRQGMPENIGYGSNRVCWGKFVAYEPKYVIRKNNIPIIRRFFSELNGAKEKKDSLSADKQEYIHLLQALRKPSDVPASENK